MLMRRTPGLITLTGRASLKILPTEGPRYRYRRPGRANIRVGLSR